MRGGTLVATAQLTLVYSPPRATLSARHLHTHKHKMTGSPILDTTL